MLHEKSCGAIVYRKYHGNTEILLIKHINSGHWSFPKGHVEKGETEVETARREIMEETSIDVIIDPTFRETVTYSPKKDTVKVVVYFLAKAKNVEGAFRIDAERASALRAEGTGELLLVDDVLTTGSTLAASAAPLTAAGFRVSCAILAFTS